MKKEKIKIENITITLTRKNIKNMYLKVIPPNGEITLSAPYSIPDIEIINFIKSKKEWILKKQKEITAKNNNTKLKYITGEKHPLWGKEYTLQLISNENLKQTLIDENKLYLPVPKHSTTNTRKEILTEFYRKEMKKEIPNVLNKCIKIVGKNPKEVKIRKMKNWGNCRLPDKRITLNINLAKKELICLEYVIIHELCHLIEFNHGKEFKKLMDTYCPNWKKIKNKLNE